ncbi:OLC1v1025477C1 [Oldenlandia corymbosa var. corymbosa]|uniref:OLC1v1025477C1 n=1 Tax=Oldenlandia corymbosa var. corymbosa TaxID=529605 RepID=A0AAV1C711_OLDCO|nr:OLC1v1025477C1 [Oldenlandia corymbosa var. corymbosa]
MESAKKKSVSIDVHLPKDIILQILARLPLKLWLRCNRGVPVNWDQMFFYSLNEKLSAVKLPNSTGHPSWMGTCNGLILFELHRAMYLWNPSTGCCRAMKKLNDSVERWQNTTSVYHGAYGLCFDKSSNDYKALWLSDRRAGVASLRTEEIEVNIGFPYYAFSSYCSEPCELGNEWGVFNE